MTLWSKTAGRTATPINCPALPPNWCGSIPKSLSVMAPRPPWRPSKRPRRSPSSWRFPPTRSVQGWRPLLRGPAATSLGFSMQQPDMAGKHVELLKRVVPQAKRIAVLLNPTHPNRADEIIRRRPPPRAALHQVPRRSESRAPRSLDEAIALAVLFHVPERRERCVERLHEHLVGDQHVEHFSPRRFRHVRNLIEEGVPTGIAHKQLRAIGDVGKHEQPRRSRCNHVRGVANGMAGSRNRSDARRNLLAPLVGRSALKNLAAHHATVVLEQTLHAARGGAAHLAVVHPELVLSRRNQDFRVRECRLVIGAEQAIHMVRVVMRDQ